MVSRALLGARRVVFASANPLVSVTGNSSPAAAFFVFSPCPHYLRLPTTPSVAALLLGRIPGWLQCPREWSQVVLLRPVPRLAPTVREIRHRHIFPRRPGLTSTFFVLPQRLCSSSPFSSVDCPAVPRPRHSTRPNSGNRGIFFKENKPKLSRIFFQTSTLNPLLFHRRRRRPDRSIFSRNFFCCLQLTAASSSSFVPAPPPIDRRRSTAQAQPGKPGDI